MAVPNCVAVPKCTQIPRQQCSVVSRDVPDTVCVQVPKTECVTVTKQVPETVCTPKPVTTCAAVPFPVTVQVPVERCDPVTREECHPVQRQVSRKDCSLVADAEPAPADAKADPVHPLSISMDDQGYAYSYGDDKSYVSVSVGKDKVATHTTVPSVR